MITVKKIDSTTAIHMVGKSTEMPTDKVAVGSVYKKVTNGSTFACVDTGDTYIFDEEEGTWTVFNVGGGGGGIITNTETFYVE